jgi:hypothetical protein
VTKLDESWRHNTYYIGFGGTGKAIHERYQKFGKWVGLGEPIWMSTVCLDENEEISFIDGRHRFAWLRDHGVIDLSIQVPQNQVRLIKTRFGTASRSSLLTIGSFI